MAFLTLAFLLRTPLVAAASVEGAFERAYSLTGAVDLELLNHSGDIFVRRGPPGMVTIRGKVHVGDRWLWGNRREDVTEIEWDPPFGSRGTEFTIDYLSYRDISVDYEITAPPSTALHPHNGSTIDPGLGNIGIH